MTTPTAYTKSEVQSALAQLLDLTEKYWKAHDAAQTPARAHTLETMSNELDALAARLQAMTNATPVMNTISTNPLDPQAIVQTGYLPEMERTAADLATQRQRPLIGDELENAVQKLIAKATELALLHSAPFTPTRQARYSALQYEIEQGLAALPED